MKSLWRLSGRIAFWLGWPGIFIYLFWSERTRVIIRCGDDILVVRGWLSDGKWNLPGGGMHPKEQPVQALLREVREETGLVLAGDQVHFVGKYQQARGLRYEYHLFAAELTQQLPVKTQRLEITDAAWLPWRDLLASKTISPDTRQSLQAWAEAESLL